MRRKDNDAHGAPHHEPSEGSQVHPPPSTSVMNCNKAEGNDPIAPDPSKPAQLSTDWANDCANRMNDSRSHHTNPPLIEVGDGLECGVWSIQRDIINRGGDEPAIINSPAGATSTLLPPDPASNDRLHVAGHGYGTAANCQLSEPHSGPPHQVTTTVIGDPQCRAPATTVPLYIEAPTSGQGYSQGDPACDLVTHTPADHCPIYTYAQTDPANEMALPHFMQNIGYPHPPGQRLQTLTLAPGGRRE